MFDTGALVAPAYGWRVVRTMIAASVKVGQLFWCAIGLCAAAIYEAVMALEQGSGESSMLALGIVVAARDDRQTESMVGTLSPASVVVPAR
ncbi:hypothetical protein [Paraburkholderia youngii]|uniref:Uncharacterized protein n=1 Tax=Paraburkholderia youngii TaxID=2782701 RepID=A0ABX2NVZ5_9BURK|nr:hypothetical protein [Paraburkholderia youngii]